MVFSFFWKKNLKKEEIFIKKIEKVFDTGRLSHPVRTEIYAATHKNESSKPRLSLLLFNDGQDMEAVGLENTLADLYATDQIKPLLVVGLYPTDRMQDYGTAHQLDYANRGSQAAAYTAFIKEDLLPFLEKEYQLHPQVQQRAFAGFSLGGLSAFDIVWKQPQLFGKTGVFSGALWWRSKPFDAEDPDGNRIVHTMVEKDNIEQRQHLRFWLQAGTEDEKDDRNNNGVIDAIDDTLDLMKALQSKGFDKNKAMKYVEVEGGQHHPATWKEVLPDFLIWAFGK